MNNFDHVRVIASKKQWRHYLFVFFKSVFVISIFFTPLFFTLKTLAADGISLEDPIDPYLRNCPETTPRDLIITENCNNLKWTSGNVTIERRITVGASGQEAAVLAEVSVLNDKVTDPERDYYSLTNQWLIVSKDIGLDNFPRSFINVINAGTISAGSYGVVNSGTIGFITNLEGAVIRGEKYSLNLENALDKEIYNQNITVINNYGTLQGGVNLGINTLNIYGSAARIVGDVKGTREGESVVNLMREARFASEGNFTVTSFNNSGLLDLYHTITASNILNDGTLNLQAGARVSGNLSGVGDVNIIRDTQFFSEGAFAVGSLTNNGTLDLSHMLTSASILNYGALNLQVGARVVGDINGSGAMNIIGNSVFSSEGNFNVGSFSNSGTFNLSNTLAASSILNNGALNLQAGAHIIGNVTGAGDVTVASGNVFTTDGSFTVGRFTNRGTLNLSNTLTASTIVNYGALNLQNGAHIIGNVTGAGDVTVANGNAFTSEGNFNANRFTNNGTFNLLHGLTALSMTNHGAFDLRRANGNVGLAGTFTQSSAGNLLMNISETNNQQLNIAGGVSLSGTLTLNASAGNYVSGKYTLLTAGALVGEFSQLNSNLSAYTRLGYGLVYDPQNVYLVFSPYLSDTQASMSALAPKIRSGFASQAAVTNFANMNTYDCELFDVNGVCVSFGGQQTYVDNPSASQTSAVVVLGYKVSPNFRMGGFLNQNVNNNTDASLQISNLNPLMGLFAVWNQNEDRLGYQVKVANAYQDKKVITIREVIGTSESGIGSTILNTQSYVSELSYAFLANKDKTLVRPYAALRYTKIKQDGYSEAASSSVTVPLSYSAINDISCTALLGVKLNHQASANINLTGSFGVEQDLYRHLDSLTEIGGAGLMSESFNEDIKRTRPVASIGAYYMPVKSQRISSELFYHQLPFQSTASLTAYVNYMIGF